MDAVCAEHGAVSDVIYDPSRRYDVVVAKRWKHCVYSRKFCDSSCTSRKFVEVVIVDFQCQEGNGVPACRRLSLG